MRKSILAIVTACTLSIGSGVAFAAASDYDNINNHTYKNTTFNDPGLTLANSGNCAGKSVETVLSNASFSAIRYIPRLILVADYRDMGWSAIAYHDTKYTDPVFELSKVPVAI